MTNPTYCTSCGHELGVGRFCTNCGKPVPGRHPEAAPSSGAPESPASPGSAVTATVPPPVGELPPSPRYPLFADAPPTVARPAPGSGTAPLGTPPPPPYAAPSASPGPGSGGRPGWLPWVVALVVLAVVAGIGAYLLASSGDDDKSASDRATGSPTQQGSGASDPSAGVPTPTEPEQPDSTGTGAPVPAPDPGEVVDLAPAATAQVPAVAPPSRDRTNRPVRYGPSNMWDGKPRTAWRMPGDGAGQTLTFDLGKDVVITEVGMINGYAKVDGPNNWYRANRRIRAVQWEFDDGTRVTQELVDSQVMQRAELGPVETRTVKVHLLTITPPAPGADGRDFTAISEIQFLGAPA